MACVVPPARGAAVPGHRKDANQAGRADSSPLPDGQRRFAESRGLAPGASRVQPTRRGVKLGVLEASRATTCKEHACVRASMQTLRQK